MLQLILKNTTTEQEVYRNYGIELLRGLNNEERGDIVAEMGEQLIEEEVLPEDNK